MSDTMTPRDEAAAKLLAMMDNRTLSVLTVHRAATGLSRVVRVYACIGGEPCDVTHTTAQAMGTKQTERGVRGIRLRGGQIATLDMMRDRLPGFVLTSLGYV